MVLGCAVTIVLSCCYLSAQPLPNGSNAANPESVEESGVAPTSWDILSSSATETFLTAGWIKPGL